MSLREWWTELWSEGPDISVEARAQALGRERLERTQVYATAGSRKVLERMRQREEALHFTRRRQA